MNKRIYIIGLLILLVVSFFIFKKDDTTKNKNLPKQQKIINILQFMNNTEIDNENIPSVKNTDDITKFEIEEANFIKDIIIDKNPICAGTDFKVTVIANNPFGPNSHLVYRIGNKTGNPAILRFNKPGLRTFYVTVRDEGKHIQMEEVNVKVIECKNINYIKLIGRLDNLEPETATFEVVSQNGLTGKCKYYWDFGDGNQEVTNIPNIKHFYGFRNQHGLQSTFIVTVKVIDSNNKSATGRCSISLPNIHYISKLMGQPILPVFYNKFLTKKYNYFESDVKVKNIFDNDVYLNTATITFYPCNSKFNISRINLNAQELLNITYFSPGKITNCKFQLNQSIIPKSTCKLAIMINGKINNKNIFTKLYFDIPPQSIADIDENRDKIINDKEMIEKLNRAKKILGKDKPITPQILKQLEEEGKI